MSRYQYVDPDVETKSLVQPGRQVFDYQLPPALPGTLRILGESIAKGRFTTVYKGEWSCPGKEIIIVVMKQVKLPGGNVNNDHFRTVRLATSNFPFRFGLLFYTLQGRESNERQLFGPRQYTRISSLSSGTRSLTMPQCSSPSGTRMGIYRGTLGRARSLHGAKKLTWQVVDLSYW